MAKKTPVPDKLNKPTVSIVTISQWKRFNCLQILCDLIKDQTYENTIEWVIVEGSKSEEDALKNADAIKMLESKVSIVYLPFEASLKLGALRNKGNLACKGDITVVMDDDDYYPSERIAHAVEKLSNSNANIAGCSAMYVYDYFLEGLYKFNEFGPFHSTNNCMAWKKEYLKKNKHDPEKDSAEESSFTLSFKEPMVQLDAIKTIVVSSHDANTYNKREILIGGTHKINSTVNQLDEPVTKFIKEPYFSRLKSIFYKESVSPYDIVYITGGFSSNWDPRDTTLGGSEQAVVHLTTEWALRGKKVAVYGQVPEITYNGVDYIDWKCFPFQAKHNVVILWRLFGLICSAPFPLKATHIWHDVHDNLKEGIFPTVWKKYNKVIQKIFFKSEYHRSEFEKSGIKLENSRCIIIPNGLRISSFSQNIENVIRNPYRFCYCSCYTRGLAKILQFIWPIIYSLEPRAELHVYYGMNAVRDKGFKDVMLGLLSQPGVMDHGRQPMDIIIREKYMSNFHLYITDTTGEIDCISIRESLITGAIPLLSTSGIFKDRPGIHFDITDELSYKKIGLHIANMLKKQDNLKEYRERLKKSPLIIGWDKIAQAWLDIAWSLD
jgi:glycosyltransferase involved in cell wall biosynthesis